MNEENETLVCQYCKSNFISIRSLTHHLKNAKYCLSLQGKTIEKYKCIGGCEKSFATNSWLIQHQATCFDFQINIVKEKYENDIAHLKNQLAEKDQTIKELAEKAIANAKPTTITHNNTNNTNIVNNLQIISEDHIKDQVKNLTLEHIKKGAIGYSEYFLEYPLKERIVCTDYARRKIKYKNENGEIVVDPEMTMLSDLLFKSIKERNRELTIQYTNELTDKFKTAKDPTQLSYFMEVAGKFSEQDIQVFKMFNGNKNDFFHDIIRNICGKTTVS